MADYYYVKNSLGTRTTGGGTTKQTGSFATLGAAAVYATVALAVADGADAGDIICVSDASSESASTIYLSGPNTGGYLSIICVEDLACQTDSIASAAQFTSSDDIRPSGLLYLYGLYLKAGDNVQTESCAGIIEERCTREVTGSGDVISNLPADGTTTTYINPTWLGATGSVPITLKGGATLEMIGGSLSTVTNCLTQAFFSGGGGVIKCYGVDLSSITGTLIKNAGNDAFNDHTIDVMLHGCQLDAGVAFTNETFTRPNHRLSIFNSAATAAVAEYQFHIEGLGGYVDDQADTGIHRDESTAFPSGTKVSAHCVTNSGASVAAPFWFDLPAQPIDLSSASTDTIRIYLTSTTALDDLDVWAEVLYSDGTNQHEYNFLSSRNGNRLATSGTALATDSGSTWKNGVSDLAGYNEYYIDLDTSGNAGAECVPIIRIYASIASAIIYFDTSIEAVA